jgi:hypothetical protein
VAASVAASQTTTSTTYTDLTTAGPSVTVTIPASGKALVILTAAVFGSTGNAHAFMSFAASPAGTTIAPTDAQALEVSANDEVRASATVLVTGLTPGSTTFTAKYRTSLGTGTFANRDVVVIPLP